MFPEEEPVTMAPSVCSPYEDDCQTTLPYYDETYDPQAPDALYNVPLPDKGKETTEAKKEKDKWDF